MPGVELDLLSRQIKMEQVLDLVDFKPTQRTGDQWYGTCPLHGYRSGRARHFSVHVAKRRYCCHRCPSRANQFELWGALTKTPLHPAMIELCHALGRKVPWIPRW